MNAAYKREYTNPINGLRVGVEFILEDGETLTVVRKTIILNLLKDWQAGYAVQKPLWIKSWTFWGARSVSSGNQ